MQTRLRIHDISQSKILFDEKNYRGQIPRCNEMINFHGKEGLKHLLVKDVSWVIGKDICEVTLKVIEY